MRNRFGTYHTTGLRATISLLGWVAIMLMLMSCNNLEKAGKHLQEQINTQTEIAMERTNLLAQNLTDSFDSIWILTQSTEEDPTLFYIFDERNMVYWSDNWLAAHEVLLLHYDEWYYWRFDNAHCICRWTKANKYNILTVVPIKYAYPIENKQLRNTFVKPFDEIKNCEIIRARSVNHIAIKAPDGRHLFSLVSTAEAPPTEDKSSDNLAETFSYQSLLANNDNETSAGERNANRGRLFYMLGILLFVSITIVGIVGLVRNHGFRDMRLRTKFMYGIMTLIVANAVYVFAISVVHMRRSYEQQQKQILQRKTRYIQKALQEIYYWNIRLNERNTVGMNIDLRDLSFAYQMDIHVFDLNGKLVGSSTPTLFEQGLLSRHIAPEPFFTSSHTMVQEEHIGDMHYLASYIELYNGNYVPIGYISVPLFISSDEVNAQVDAFLAKLLPPTLLVLAFSFILSLILSQGLTQPLSILADKMKYFRIGQHTNRLHYKNNDEIGELVVRYNALMDELEHSAEQLANSEREGAWRTMARQIAHEINNTLTPMKLTIQQVQRAKKKDPEQFDTYFNKATYLLIEQIENLSHIAQSFSTFAKMPEVVVSEVDIAQKITSVIEFFRTNQTEIPIRYIGVERSVIALTDSEQVSRVFNNLIKNALQAVEHQENGDIIIILKKLPTMVEISISDNGSGIAPEIQDQVFRPNFTTKSTGMGLGLAISKNIIEGSGGTITFETSSKGTTFYVHLPYPKATDKHHIIEVEAD